MSLLFIVFHTFLLSIVPSSIVHCIHASICVSLRSYSCLLVLVHSALGIFLVLYFFRIVHFCYQFVRTKCKIHVNKTKVFIFFKKCTNTSKSFSISLFSWAVVGGGVLCAVVFRRKWLSPVCECMFVRVRTNVICPRLRYLRSFNFAFFCAIRYELSLI